MGEVLSTDMDNSQWYYTWNMYNIQPGNLMYTFEATYSGTRPDMTCIASFEGMCTLAHILFIYIFEYIHTTDVTNAYELD